MNDTPAVRRSRFATPASLAFLSAAFIVAFVGCGGDDTSNGASSTATTTSCGTLDAPELLTLVDVEPLAGSSVPNGAVIHAFTIKDAPASLNSLTMLLPGGHTAGNSDPPQWKFVVTPDGADLRYEAAPIEWQNAPASVYVQISDRFQVQDGCVYAFPDPVFQYSVTAGGEGGSGGAGGSGGSGGAGGSGGSGGAGGSGG